MTDPQQLIDRIERKRGAHQSCAADRQKLVNVVAQQINRELDLIESIERTAHQIETSVDELIAKNEIAPAYVKEQYQQLHRAHTRLSFLVSAIQPQKLEAAE